MKVGVTGATGALGLRLTEKLLEKNFKVKVLVRKTSKIEKLDKNKIEFIYGDITDYQSLNDFIKDIEICFHIAAQVDFTSKKNFFDINVNGTDNICKAILEHNPSCRLIHCSTISTLKINPFFTIKSSDYGVSKYYGEKKVMEYIKNNNLKATIIYPGVIYGPYDKTVIPPTLQLLKYNLVRLTKGGEDCAPIIYVDELCDLFIKAALNEKSIGKRYISVKGADIGIHEFTRMIAQKMNLSEPQKIYNKKLMFIKALYMELLYKIMGKKEKPPIYRTLVNIFSINFKTYKKRYDDPLADLGWTQSTSREFIDKTLDISLNWIKKIYGKK